MEHTAKGLRKKLLSLIRKLGKTPEVYASRPGKDFTRRRVLGFENIVLLLLTMCSESVGKNLMEVFHFQKKTPSALAFVQQRKALCEMASRSAISEPVIVLADQNYGSLNNLAHLENRGWNCVIRLKERDSDFAGNFCRFSYLQLYTSRFLRCKDASRIAEKTAP